MCMIASIRGRTPLERLILAIQESGLMFDLRSFWPGMCPVGSALEALEPGALDSKGERENIVRLPLLHKWFVERPQKGKGVHGRL